MSYKQSDMWMASRHEGDPSEMLLVITSLDNELTRWAEHAGKHHQFGKYREKLTIWEQVVPMCYPHSQPCIHSLHVCNVCMELVM